MTRLIFLSALFIAFLNINAQQQDIETFLAGKNQITYNKINVPGNMYSSSYLIFITQPLDHNHPEKGTFRQRIWLSLKDTINKHPVVMITEGYSANRNYISELARMLDANQIIVEHRYFSESAPDTLNWQYLTVEQAATDHHEIINLFRQIFRHKWITTGISKGGQAAIYHRAFFPDDVDVTVPYVAPINFAREDPRLYQFFHKVGKKHERKRIHDFQKLVLEKRDVMMKMMQERAALKGWTFRIGYDKAFDIAVLEYPFSFWQWGHNINSIPSDTASDDEIFSNLIAVSDFSYECDQEWNKLKPFFYQAYKEIGYYSYVPGDLKPLIKGFDKDTISSDIFAPGGDTLKYTPQTMRFVMESLKKHNPRIIAITGESDPWGATSLIVDDIPNAYKFVNPEGCHRTRIYNLPDEMKNEIYKLLKEWTGFEIKKL
ncbi:MAG: peptidase [Chlorobi bacterium]|nr:peptidase [Chlorobiota bacterium]